MSESRPGGPKSLTHDELTRKVRSLRSVGGVYELLADVVENDNRPHCRDEVKSAERQTPVHDVPDRFPPPPEGHAASS